MAYSLFIILQLYRLYFYLLTILFPYFCLKQKKYFHNSLEFNRYKTSVDLLTLILYYYALNGINHIWGMNSESHGQDQLNNKLIVLNLFPAINVSINVIVM